MLLLFTLTRFYFKFQLALMLAGVRGRPQYNYPIPSGGIFSPGGYDRPSNGKAPGGSFTPSNLNEQRENFGGQFSNQKPLNSGFDYNQPEAIQKNVYVHIPPPELEEDLAPPPSVKYGQPEKNYKIIFIKAPSPALPQSSAYSAQPPKEEKTLIYVLVKKPDDISQTVIATPAPTQPSKPEVFFIRYKPVREGNAQEGGRYSKDTGEQTLPLGETGGQTYSAKQTGSAGTKYLPSAQRSLAVRRTY